MSNLDTLHSKYSIRARVSEFVIPPIKDGLIMGKSSPIGCNAIRNALELLLVNPFVHLKIEGDDVISDILIRQGVLRRFPKEKLIHFVKKQIKPLMADDELIHLEISAEVLISDDLI